MGVLGDKGSWCFCSGGDARSERVKGSIYTAKGPSIASICSTTGGERKAFGTGFMIHKGLLLTTHTNIPSVPFAETGCDVKLGFGRIQARLVPQRFFITSSILDLTIVGLDAVSDETLNYIKTGFNTTLDLGNTTYLLGHTTPRNDLTIGEGKIVISTDNLIKLSTDSFSFSPGSAGFDMHGNLSFMLCDPMKLATSPMARSGTGTVPTCGYSLSRKDSPMQFGVPVPVILDWLRQHWSGSLDEVTKPKLDPPVRLVSGPSKGGLRNGTGESSASHPKMNLLDINFPPRPAPPPRSIFLPLPLKQMLSEGCNSNNYDNNNNNNNNHNNCNNSNNDDYDNNAKMNVGPSRMRAEVESEQESNCCYSEVQSSSSPVHLHYYDDGFTTGDDETMYSAETMESRNIPSPRRKTLNPNPSFENNYESRVSSVGRSQSCVNNTRWSSSPINRGVLSKQNSLVPVRRSNSQTGPQRNSQDFLSPTVSSAMKKRNSVEKEKQVVPIIRAKQGPNRGPSKWVS